MRPTNPRATPERTAHAALDTGDVGENPRTDDAAPVCFARFRDRFRRPLRDRFARGGGGEAEGLGGRGRTPRNAPAAARQRKLSSAVSPRPRLAFKTFARNLRARVAKGPLLRVMTWLMLMVQYGSMKCEA